MEAILYRLDGTKSRIRVNSFMEASKLVSNYDPNGLAEVVRLNNGEILVIDQDGKLKNYSINEQATSLAHLHDAIYPHDSIVGDALLLDENQFEELSYE
jgi:hypothetical protein